MLEGCVPRPDSEVAEYRRAGYWAGAPLGALLRQWAADHPDRTALVDAQVRWTYRELDDRADRFAAGARRFGLCPGDRVVVQLPNVAEFAALCFGLFRAGVVPVFSLPSHRSHEIRHLCELSGASAYVLPAVHRGFDHRAIADEVRSEVPPVRHAFVLGDPGAHTALSDLDADPAAWLPEDEPDPTDVAFFLLSGGTTALPKLIPRTHDDYAYQLRTAAEICALGPDSVYLATLPISFNFTWACPGVLGTMHSGGKVVLASSPSPEECFPLIADEGVTTTSVAPTVAHLWMEAVPHDSHDLSTLELVQVGSAPLHREVAERIAPALGCQLQQVFGMVEGLLTMTRLDDDAETVLTTQGRPISPADEVRIVTPGSERDVPAGEVGELLCRGPYTLKGYYRAPEHNAEVFTADGHYRTGDLARLTSNGDLVVEGRVKDVVNRGGDKVSATELEGHLLHHENVQQAAVVPLPDPVLGEAVCACVVPEGAPPRLIDVKKLLVRRGIAQYKLPDRVEVYEQFPLTGLGKVDKNQLADDVRDRAGAAR